MRQGQADDHGHFLRFWPDEARAEVFDQGEWVPLLTIEETIVFESPQYQYVVEPGGVVTCHNLRFERLNIEIGRIEETGWWEDQLMIADQGYRRIQDLFGDDSDLDAWASPDAQRVTPSRDGTLLDRIDEALEDWGWVR